MIFGVARIVMLFSFGDFSTLSGRTGELLRMFNHGFRYDIRTATIALAPFTLTGLILLVWPTAAQYYIKRLHIVFTALGVAALTASICNHYYYATFGSYFDIFIFGLVEEDTKAVLINIWEGYPILISSACIIIAVVVIKWALKRYSLRFESIKWRTWPPSSNALLLLIFLTCYGVCVHGSLGRYPLERRDAQVSSLKLLNMLTPNGVMALEWAFSDHRKDQNYPKADDAEGQKLFSQFFGHPVPKSEITLKQFADRTPKNSFLEQHPPHVVFAVMESLSTHLLSFDSPPKSDLLGAWRPFWQRDYTFIRFLPDGNGTMESLARLLVASPVSNISQSKAQRTSFESNIVRPYKLNGYRTLFITSGNGSWRNLSRFLKDLGFDEVVEQSDLIRKYPEATQGTWGTFDEFSFRYAEERIKEADMKKEKLFVMLLSITNHPPYIVPATYAQLPHALPESVRQRLSALPYSVDSVIATYQYANDAIGRFIQRIERSPFGGRTIIAVTGDHNTRGIPYPDPAEIVMSYAVPFYLRVPAEYRNIPDLTYDPLRVGSHKDIMPTLYALSLSDTPYFRRGVNLLAKNISAPWYFAYNENLTLTEKGAYRLAKPTAFYPWQDDKGPLVKPERTMDATQQLEAERLDSYKSIMSWQLNRQVNRQP
jgi:phosphoglycerol transferase MdoB-like AlkP superfamily enzyme